MAYGEKIGSRVFLIHERAKFFTANQEASHSPSEFENRLRQLSKMQFISRIRNERVRIKLLAKDELPFKKAVRYIKTDVGVGDEGNIWRVREETQYD